MIIAADIRNTSITLGCAGESGLERVFTIATDLAKTEHEYAAAIKAILDFYGLESVGFDGAIISSVVPRLTPVLREAVRLLTGRRALVVGAGVKTGLNILIDNPAQLGGDLVSGAVGALAEYPVPAIIIDFCTATTFSAVNSRSDYLGCAISPGLDISLRALSGSASLLTQVTIEAPRRCIGTNTDDSMKSGAILGMAAMVEGMTGRIEAEMGEKARSIIATGPFAGAIVPHCGRDIIMDEHLTLKGLCAIYAKNKKIR